jgi:predicted GTPase
MADVVVIAKSDAAPRADVSRVEAAVRRINPRARRLRGASPVTLDDAAAARGRRVIVVEDGPTTTHGGMAHGAGYAAARAAGAEIVDPRGCAAPAIAPLYAQYPQLGPVLPAMGYSAAERAALAATIEASRAELVVSGTPHDLGALLGIRTRVLRARYEFAEVESPGLWGEVAAFLRRAQLAR